MKVTKMSRLAALILNLGHQETEHQALRKTSLSLLSYVLLVRLVPLFECHTAR